MRAVPCISNNLNNRYNIAEVKACADGHTRILFEGKAYGSCSLVLKEEKLRKNY
jgi:hypothetical protein